MERKRAPSGNLGNLHWGSIARLVLVVASVALCLTVLLLALGARQAQDQQGQPPKEQQQQQQGQQTSWLILDVAQLSSARKASAQNDNSSNQHFGHTRLEQEEDDKFFDLESLTEFASRADSPTISAGQSFKPKNNGAHFVEPKESFRSNSWPAASEIIVHNYHEEKSQANKQKPLTRHKRRSSAMQLHGEPQSSGERMRFVLMCQVLDGEPPIQIKWFKDKHELPAVGSGGGAIVAEPGAAPQEPTSAIGGDIEMISNDELGSSLLFRKVKQQHGGNYSCLASNHVGSASYSSFMTVKEATPFKLINSNHHVQTLENGSLAIRQTGRDHEGAYLCEADNGVEPSLAKLVRLVVHKQAHFFDDLLVWTAPQAPIGDSGQLQAPAPQQQLSNPVAGIQVGGVKTVRLAQNATNVRLVCLAHGDAPMQLDWLKEGRLVNSWSSSLSSESNTSASETLQLGGARLRANSRFNKQRAHFESELLLAGPLARQDAALYECQARNPFGQAERRLRLIVQEAPEAPPLVELAHVSARSVGLRWLAPFDGESAITEYAVEWRRIGAHEHQEESSGSNQVLAGWARSIKAMPQQQHLGGALKLANALGAGQQQQQQGTSGGAQLAPVASLPGQTVQHSVHDLEPLTRYAMRVIAVNSLGQSRPSAPLSLQTEEEVPSTVPNLVGATVLGSRHVKLHWTLTYSPERELIDGFFIGYRSLEGAQQALLAAAGQLQLSGSALDSSASDQSRPTFTYKTIRLATAEGRAQQSAALLQASDPSGPAVVSPVASASKAIVQQAKGSGAAQSLAVVQSQFEHVIGGLERNTEYTILIQCFNRKGAGPTSDPVVFRTFASDPPEKLLASADELSESALRLEWRFKGERQQEAANSGGAQLDQLVDGFVLTYARLQQARAVGAKQQLASGANSTRASHQFEAPQATHRQQGEHKPTLGQHSLSLEQQQQDQLQQQWQAVQLAPMARSHVLKNLDCGTWYAIKIWAFNKMGKGEPSDVITASTRGKAPVAPSRHSFLTINSTQVRLHLSAWYDGGCEIAKFSIQYRARRQQQDWTLVSSSVSRDQQAVIIRDLAPATAYELLVGAHNSVGRTEAKYRLTTLDSEGKQVGSSYSFAMLGASSDQDADQDSDETLSLVDYVDETGTRREVWLQQHQQQQQQQQNNSSEPGSTIRWLMLALRQFLNSFLTLAFSLCLLVVMLLLLVFNRYNCHKQQDSAANSNGSLDSQANPFKTSAYIQASQMAGRHCSLDATTATLLDGGSEPPLSITNGSSSLTDVSPARVNLTGNHRLTLGGHLSGQSYATPLIDCGGANGANVAYCRSQQVNQRSHDETTCDTDGASNYAIAGPAGLNVSSSSSVGPYGFAAAAAPAATTTTTTTNSSSNYASVHRSAIMGNSGNHHHYQHDESLQQQHACSGGDDDRQQYLLQMLLATPQHEQQQNNFSMTEAALTTLARQKSAQLQGVPVNQRPNSFLGQQHYTDQIPNGCLNIAAMTLGRAGNQHISNNDHDHVIAQAILHN